MSTLDKKHNDAIRGEIGERLGTLRKPEKLPPRFRRLIDRLAKVDYKMRLPSIVPLGAGWLRRMFAGRLR